MPERPIVATDDAVVATRPARADAGSTPSEFDARLCLERHRAETERMRVLIDFLARPIHAYGGSENPDPDVISAYNLAVEAALQGVRRAAAAT